MSSLNESVERLIFSVDFEFKLLIMREDECTLRQMVEKYRVAQKSLDLTHSPRPKLWDALYNHGAWKVYQGQDRLGAYQQLPS